MWWASEDTMEDGDCVVIGFNLFDGLPRCFISPAAGGKLEWAVAVKPQADPLLPWQCNFRSLFVFSGVGYLVCRKSIVLVPDFRTCPSPIRLEPVLAEFKSIPGRRLPIEGLLSEVYKEEPTVDLWPSPQKF